jgi:acetolactate synthase-1/2/3 large subunit
LAQIAELLVYDCEGVQRYYRLDSFSGVHDILCDGQHYIVVSTGKNTIVWISPSGEIVQRWQAPGEEDSWHLNSLLMKDGDLFISAFGRFSRNREWNDHKTDGTGFVSNFTKGHDVLTGLSCPHSPRFIDDFWVVCNSATSEVLQIEPATGDIRKRLKLNGWTRGIAVCDDILFVGESANRHDPLSKGTATIAVVCRKSWTVLDRFSLPCREIYDLVLVPVSLAEGARRGFRTNPLRIAEQDQYAMFKQIGVEPVRLWATGDPLPPEACKVKIQAEVPAELAADAMVELRCVVENLGTAIFVTAPPNPVHLSYRWVRQVPGDQSKIIEGMRTRLPRSLPPKQPLDCGLKVKSPPLEGEWELQVTLVQEKVAWFDHLSEKNTCSTRVRVVKSGVTEIGQSRESHGPCRPGY